MGESKITSSYQQVSTKTGHLAETGKRTTSQAAFTYIYSILLCIALPYPPEFGGRTAALTLRVHTVAATLTGSVASYPDECKLPAT